MEEIISKYWFQKEQFRKEMEIGAEIEEDAALVEEKNTFWSK